jgi:aryl-alcohol dehydrogenase-like predicted oxidoreductase
VQAVCQRYADLARQHGLTPARLALAWCYSRWFVASTIIGATNLTQLQENIDAWDVKLTPELEAAINAIHADVCATRRSKCSAILSLHHKLMSVTSVPGACLHE